MVVTVWLKGMRWWRNGGWQFGADGDGVKKNIFFIHERGRKLDKKKGLIPFFLIQ